MEGTGLKQWMRAVGTLFATVVGVGVFGLPYVFSRAGFGLALIELAVLTLVIVVVSLMYAELTMATPGKHRYVAYIQHALGPVGGKIAGVVVLLSVFGALWAFTIIGGDFLSALLPGLSPILASIAVLAIAALLASGGLRFVSQIVVWIVLGLLALYAILIVSAVPSFAVAHLPHHALTFRQLVLPYGVILFSLTGIGAIPEMHDLLGRRPRRLIPAILAAYGLIFLLYALFAFFVVGASGAATSADAISGLAPFVAPWVSTLGALLGTISVISIFTLLSMENINSFVIDMHLSHRYAFLITFGVPVALFLLASHQFISVMGLVGAILNGALGILIILAYERQKKTGKKRLTFHLPHALSFLVFIALALGMIVEIVYTK